MQFPSRIGRFNRLPRPTVYDPMGYNVSVGYNESAWIFKSKRAWGTVYVYPSPMVFDTPAGSLRAEFERAKSELLRLSPDATPLAESDASLTDSEGTVAGRQALFLMHARGALTVSELKVFRRGIWVLKLRLSSHASRRNKNAGRSAEFLRVLGCPRGL